MMLEWARLGLLAVALAYVGWLLAERARSREENRAAETALLIAEREALLRTSFARVVADRETALRNEFLEALTLYADTDKQLATAVATVAESATAIRKDLNNVAATLDVIRQEPAVSCEHGIPRQLDCTDCVREARARQAGMN